MTAAETADPEADLIDFIGGMSRDPLAFVLAAFPWGEPGPLADRTGPDKWQRELLLSVKVGLKSADQVIQEAVASGHGVGKSALVSWLLLWAMSTHEDTRGVVTANTENQLRTKTWAELSKWHRLCICRHWFRLTATALFSVQPSHEKTWRIDAVPWSESNTEAFAGLHNEGKRIIVVFDEASAIPDVIWETTEGALTDANTEILWFAFGNPTRNTGRFRECFGRLRHRWVTEQIDSRSVAITNKEQIAQWVADYGEDSDFVRVRVRGVFPRAGSMQFIDGERVQAAMTRKAEALPGEPLVMGVDVARFGDDQSVIAFRRGRDARTLPWIALRGLDTMQVAAKVAEAAKVHRAQTVFVDEGGLGAGVVDRLHQLGLRCIGVNFGGSPSGLDLGEGVKVKNKRAEMWAASRNWLRLGSIPDDPELQADLTGVEYGFDASNAIQLEKKEHMKKRGLASPDKGDALALTFAFPVGSEFLDDDDDRWESDHAGRSAVTGY
jgi:hypothetical protein